MAATVLKTLFLFLMLLSTVKSNWDGDNSDPTLANLGFYVHNMTCKDDTTICQHCAHLDLVGRPFILTTEYTSGPYKFKYYFEDGMQDWNIYFAQEDQSQEYRWCEDIYDILDISTTVRVALCVENTFSDISVPDNCPKPVALVSYDYHPSDGQVRGQQMLYCLS
ncbi:uncharacterized protein LOC110977461 [Acanthaster planci]|uniref:Uncharacterized protein LOC110977461 n=1 Tax=Acanthaster planci TaxID=133434 RepID=A0A8B7Y4R9_ACAPL|nr:uncharacterized protein LOC110977461 [Acanthaster planci]